MSRIKTPTQVIESAHDILETFLEHVEKTVIRCCSLEVQHDHLTTLSLADKWPRKFQAKPAQHICTDFHFHLEDGTMQWQKDELKKFNNALQVKLLDALQTELDATKTAITNFSDIKPIRRKFLTMTEHLKDAFPGSYGKYEEYFIWGNPPLVEYRQSPMLSQQAPQDEDPRDDWEPTSWMTDVLKRITNVIKMTRYSTKLKADKAMAAKEAKRVASERALDKSQVTIAELAMTVEVLTAQVLQSNSESHSEPRSKRQRTQPQKHSAVNPIPKTKTKSKTKSKKGNNAVQMRVDVIEEFDQLFRVDCRERHNELILCERNTAVSPSRHQFCR